MQHRYQIDERWPPYARERLLFFCRPFEYMAAGIAIVTFAAGAMMAIL
ncbi:hypothetical protein GR212_28635 [Rhizobium lusitanum]|uniref:Uncharacterized protein n=1 Tax=Rhizobium lusitanum TaxID=293958 RepID=A0A6L9UHD3_9HYPH|nr:hypothetical protein [Rhizobium lusitanum]NEI73526.1 hypothetical protein [Rhizobium lusitanum]